MADYYELLEVAHSATPEEIRAAITAQRRIWVRRQSSPDPDRRTEAEQRVRDIDAAERTLLDGERRRAYDVAGPMPSPPPAAARDEPEQRMPPPRPTTGTGVVGSAAFHLRRGDMYLDQGKWPLAIEEYEVARERDPENVEALEGIAQAYLRSGRVNEALAVLEDARKEQPDHEGVKQALAATLYDSALAAIEPDHLITSRRELRTVKTRLRRLRKLGLRDRRTVMMAAQLRDVVADAQRAVWRRSYSKKWYAILLTGSVLLALSQQSTFSYVVGGVFFAAFVALYVVRHRIPRWKLSRKTPRWR